MAFHRPSQPFFSFHPWFLFGIFFLANVLLSYFSLGIQAKLWIGLLGLILPFLIAIRFTSTHDRKPLYLHEFLPPIPWWSWALLGIAAVFLRFYKLTTLSAWPHFDEGTYGYYALQVLEGDFDRFFHGNSKEPPFFFYLVGLGFKAFGPSLSLLWFWPAFFSLLFVALGYSAARQFFSRSFSFVCACLMGTGFWPLFSGRFCMNTALILPSTALAFWGLGKLFSSTFRWNRKILTAALALAVGLVFYAIYLHWIMPSLMVSLLAVRWMWTRSRRLIGIFGLVLGSILLPFGVLALQSGFSQYLRFLWIGNAAVPLSQKMEVAFSYLQSIYWGVPAHFYTYQPVWGGFLNPICGSLFFLGALEACKKPREPMYRWLAAGFVFFLLPGVLSRELEPFRILPLLVVLIPVIALGAARLVSNFSLPRSAMVLLALLVPSLGLDFHHLAGPYHRLWDSPESWRGYHKSVEHFRAYGLLRERARKDGPGWLFLDFTPGLPDQTLGVAGYSFNALRNPRLATEQAKWAAVLVNVHYRPLLDGRLGVGKAFLLSKGLSEPSGGWMLWVGTVTESNVGTLRQWQKASSALAPFLDQNISYVRGQPYENLVPVLQRAYPAFKDDPFLEACFWEKMGDILLKSGQVPEAISALDRATLRGYPAAHLFQRLGTLWLVRQNPGEAQKAFRLAVQSPLDFTDAALYLQRLRTFSTER